MTAASFAAPAIFLLIALAVLVFAVAVIVDMARRPRWVWEQAGSNKVLWLVLEIVLFLLSVLLALVVGVLYLTMVRPRLLAAEQRGAGPWPGTGPEPWSGSTWGPPVHHGAATEPPQYPVAGAPAPPPYPAAPPGSSNPPFGWYPDPAGRHQLRYWDGTTWTEHVSDAGAQAIDPLPGQAG